MDNSLIDIRQPEPQPNDAQMLGLNSSSHTCTKPPVGGSMVYLMDCVAGMKEYPDKYFDLAIVDPPYGELCNIVGGRKFSKMYKKGDQWNDAPMIEYYTELFRVSQNQIIWGANYLVDFLPPSKGWICWYKKNPAPGFSDCEFAYSSFHKAARVFEYQFFGNIEGNTQAEKKIHPTQKPIKLYEWILSNYAEKGQRILDTHLGSGSSRIAADKYGMDFTGFEVNETYYNLSEKRFMQYKSQPSLFEVW